MPTSSYRSCLTASCPNPAVARGRCREHARDYERDTLPSYPGLAKTRRFLRLRHSFLVRHPVCAICHREPARELDHILPHRGDAKLFWDQANWQGLCHRCHSRKTWHELLS